MTRIGWLAAAHVEDWRKGRQDFLLKYMQVNPRKVSQAIEIFHAWARGKGLNATEASYQRVGREGPVALRFTETGDADAEKIWRTHFVSPALTERKKEKLQEKLERPRDPVVFEIVREAQCSECGAEIPKNDLLMMEAGQPLCLSCVRMDDLEFLPAGDTALTRRASKYSPRKAVVVRFSRSRGRYERQGILVEKDALEKAEGECVADADQRAEARQRAAERRVEEDRDLAARMTEGIRELFPRIPPGEAARIAGQAAVRGSGRVGRSAAGRNLEEQALTMAVAAAVRHNHTNYDELLAKGLDRADARSAVAENVTDILDAWRAKR